MLSDRCKNIHGRSVAPVVSDDRRIRSWSIRAHRDAFWNGSLDDCAFDVVVIGGGVQGACIYHRLARLGYAVLLVDRGDFGGGTSQSSAMLAWGGLLYLRDGRIGDVCRLSAARERLLRDHGQLVRPHTFRYISRPPRHRSPALLHAALWLYWALGACRRRCPGRESLFPELALLREDKAEGVVSLAFEEAQLNISDAAFVLDWILAAPVAGESAVGAVNYCAAVAGDFDGRAWRMELADTLSGRRRRQVRARVVVNAAGVWADRVNHAFDVEAPFRHALSKGVSLTFPRHPMHRDTLLFDSVRGEEGLSLVPWGPVSVWGSTETPVDAPEEGRGVDAGDVGYLLDSLNLHLATPLRPGDIIAVRCGVRPLVVPRSSGGGSHPLDLSRRHRVWRDRERPWITVFGGKLTGCVSVAEDVLSVLPALNRPRPIELLPPAEPPAPDMEHFCGINEPVPTPGWCAEHAHCCTLDDYLRRRTNLAQWVPRGGLGAASQFRHHLSAIAAALYADGQRADEAVSSYVDRIDRERCAWCAEPGAAAAMLQSTFREEAHVLHR